MQNIPLITSDELLKLPADQMRLQIYVNKYKEILNDIKEPCYTPDMFEYWWVKTAISEDEKAAVMAELKRVKLLLERKASEIVTWDKMQELAANVLNKNVFSSAIEAIKKDESIFEEKNHSKKMSAVLTFENQRTSLGVKNLLVRINMSFEGEYGGERSLLPEIAYIRAFDGWPAEITEEVESAKDKTTPLKAGE